MNLHGTYTDSVEFIKHTIVNEGNMVFAGSNYVTNELILVKTNRIGEFIQESAIPYMAGPYPNIGYLPSTDQLICGRYNWLGYIDNDDLTEDTAYYPLAFYFFSYGFYKPLDDSHCLLPAQFLKIPPDIGKNVGCMVIDTIAQMTNSVVFDLPFEDNMAIEADYITTDSIFLGAIKNSYAMPPQMGFNHIDRWFGLYKFNFSGEIFWEKYFGGHGNNILMYVTATSDGGCGLFGTYYDWRTNPVLERDVVIYKVNSEGLLTNIPEIADNFVQVFPNPASDQVFIKFSEENTPIIQKKIVQVYDNLGNRLFSTDEITDNEFVVNVSDFAPGIYVFRIISDHDFQFSQKVVVY